LLPEDRKKKGWSSDAVLTSPLNTMDQTTQTRQANLFKCGLRSQRSGGNAYFAESAARKFASFTFISRKDSVHAQLRPGFSGGAQLPVNTSFQQVVKLIQCITVQINVSSFLHNISSVIRKHTSASIEPSFITDLPPLIRDFTHILK